MNNLMQSYIREQAVLLAKYQALLAAEGLPSPTGHEPLGVYEFQMHVDMRLFLKGSNQDFSSSNVQYALTKRMIAHVEQAIAASEAQTIQLKIHVGRITWARRLFDEDPLPSSLASDTPKSSQDVRMELRVVGFGTEDAGLHFVKERLADAFADSTILRDLEAGLVPGCYGLEFTPRYRLA